MSKINYKPGTDIPKTTRDSSFMRAYDPREDRMLAIRELNIVFDLPFARKEWCETIAKLPRK